MGKKYLLSICFLTAILLSTTTVTAVKDAPVIVSEGAILVDADTGQVLYEKNPHTSFPPASITKLMTALLTLENLAPNDEITFSRNAVMSIERGSSHIGMRENEIISVEDALHGLLLQSANEVANGLAENVSGSIEAFTDVMNERAAELGAQGTHFINPNGLYDENHYTTAYDMSLIMRELLKHDYFLEVMSHYSWQIQATNMVDEIRYLRQGHKLLNPKRDPSLYRPDVIAGKSGYTIKSGFTLVSVAKEGSRTLIAVTLRTDSAHLYSDTNELLDYGLEAFESMTIFPSDFTQVIPVSVSNASSGEATVTLKGSATIQVPVGTKKDTLSLLPALPSTVDADASANEIIGALNIFLEDQAIASVPLVIRAMEVIEMPDVEPQAPLTLDTKLPENNPDDKKPNYFWLVMIIFSFTVLFFLYYFNRSSIRSYGDYKKLRDEEVSKNTVKDAPDNFKTH